MTPVSLGDLVEIWWQQRAANDWKRARRSLGISIVVSLPWPTSAVSLQCLGPMPSAFCRLT